MNIKLIAIISLLWAGMILGISFLESWIKFRASTLTKPVGLEVGRVVFNAFHKAQVMILIIIAFLSFTTHLTAIIWLMLSALALLLGAQLFWFFPQLSQRVNIILAGGQTTSSPIHALYGIAEIIKLFLLITLSTLLII